MPATHEIPVTSDGLTPRLLTHLVSEAHPGATVTDVSVLGQRGDDTGVGISTSALVYLQLRYGAGTPEGLPVRAAVKMMVNNPDPYYKVTTADVLE